MSTRISIGAVAIVAILSEPSVLWQFEAGG
jgi:hypothetical protein